MKGLRNIWYSFPIRLLLAHGKYHVWLLFPWILLWLIVAQKIGANKGIPYLFLDPQYAGDSNYVSFSILGFCFGGFYVTWNIVSYMLNSWRYPFMASLKWPVTMYFINNLPLPLAFLIYWLVQLYTFQNRFQFEQGGNIVLLLLGFVLGILLALLITAVYFSLTNKDIFGYIKGKKIEVKPDEDWFELDRGGRAEPVSFFISRNLRIRPVREVKHYDDILLKQVFRQHHFNTFILQLITIAALIVLGLFIDIPVFEIPAGGSVMLFFSFVMALVAFFMYWSGTWGTVAFIAFILITNKISGFEGMINDSRAYGLNYQVEPASYDLYTFSNMVTPERLEADEAHMLSILEAWKRKVKEERPYNYKPKMTFIISTGGGLRSSLFTMKVLQTADSTTAGSLLDHTVLMTGASGGTFGLAYFRELLLKQRIGLVDSIYHKKYLDRIAKDQLNKWATAAVTNDLFVPIKSREILGYRYKQDRGMFQEIAFSENIEHVMDKPISAYKTFEDDATVPLLITGTTSTNDMRQFLISPQPISYLMQARAEGGETDLFEIDAIDFCRFFQDQDGYNVGMMSALRMNATFPLVMPAVTLPTEPRVEVMDAGARDNYGMQTTLRFIETFQDWINENTSGVLIVQIRGSVKKNKPQVAENRTYISKFIRPLGNVIANMTTMQDFTHDYMLDALERNIEGGVEMIRFEYEPPEDERRASMSLHLTKMEKKNIVGSAVNPTHVERYERIKEILPQR